MKSEVVRGLKIFWVRKDEALPRQDQVAEDEIFVKKRKKIDGDVYLSMQTHYSYCTHSTRLKGKKETLKRALAEIYVCDVLAKVSELLEQHLNGFSYKTGLEKWLIDQ
jgi:hypothetical protein